MRAVQHTKEIGDYDYYVEYSLTNLYVEVVFGGLLSTINITNDSLAETVSFSFDGATLAGEVKPGESVAVTVDQKSSIYIKGSAGSDTCRLWGWAGVVKAASTVNADGSVNVLTGFEIPPYDEVDFTWVTVGNGIGEVETIIFSASSTPHTTLTFTYNASDQVTKIAKT